MGALAREPILQAGIDKLIRILEGENESQFNAEQYMKLYTCEGGPGAAPGGGTRACAARRSSGPRALQAVRAAALRSSRTRRSRSQPTPPPLPPLLQFAARSTTCVRKSHRTTTLSSCTTGTGRPSTPTSTTRCAPGWAPIPQPAPCKILQSLRAQCIVRTACGRSSHGPACAAAAAGRLHAPRPLRAARFECRMLEARVPPRIPAAPLAPPRLGPPLAHLDPPHPLPPSPCWCPPSPSPPAPPKRCCPL
jgi:hypothetical protein